MALGDARETLISGTVLNGWWLPEHTRARGPVLVGDIGNGSLSSVYGYEWLVELDRTDFTLRLYVHYGGAWVEEALGRSPIPTPHDLRKIRSLSLAFDTSGQPVVAYEIKGKMYVRQYAGTQLGFIWRGPFSGHDPVLIPDSPTHRQMDQGTVWLYHTTLARDGIVRRDGIDQFTIPYIAAIGDSSIPQPCYVLGAFSIDNQFRVAIGNSDQVNVIDILERFPPPPVEVSDTFPGSSEIVLGEEFDWVILKEVTDALITEVGLEGLEFASVVDVNLEDKILPELDLTGSQEDIIIEVPMLVDTPILEASIAVGSEDLIVFEVEIQDTVITEGGITDGSEI